MHMDRLFTYCVGSPWSKNVHRLDSSSVLVIGMMNHSTHSKKDGPSYTSCVIHKNSVPFASDSYAPVLLLFSALRLPQRDGRLDRQSNAPSDRPGRAAVPTGRSTISTRESGNPAQYMAGEECREDRKSESTAGMNSITVRLYSNGRG